MRKSNAAFITVSSVFRSSLLYALTGCGGGGGGVGGNPYNFDSPFT